MSLVMVESSAEFSPCRRYRYSLTRRFADGPTVAFIGLNPSTADEHADDPTIRRCLGFARRWGYGTLLMLNLYALRSTDPKGLWGHPWPQGEPPEYGGLDANLYAIGDAVAAAKLIVCAWGADPGPIESRPADVFAVLPSGARTAALGLTKHGQPRHPLYMRADTEPTPYELARPHVGTADRRSRGGSGLAAATAAEPNRVSASGRAG